MRQRSALSVVGTGGIPLRRAFTLVELLVVIAIIGLLVAILLPQLSAARSLARSAVCRSNLGQIAKAMTGGRDGGSPLTLDPRGFPETAYAQMPLDEIYACPEDDPSAGAVARDLYYMAYWGSMHHRLEFQEGFLGPDKIVSVRSRRGKDEQRGGYTEYVFEENSGYSCHFGLPVSDNDGVFRVYDDLGEDKRALTLMYYTCNLENKAFMGDSGLFEPGGTLKGHAGETVYVSSFYTSYGANVAVGGPDIGPDTVMLLDYEPCEGDDSAIADVERGNVTERLRLSDRHLGRLNVLYLDQSVRSHWPAEVFPEVSPGAWSGE